LYSSLSAYDEGAEQVAGSQGSAGSGFWTFKQGLLTMEPTYSTGSIVASAAVK
jgi:hypothetical protein